MTAVTNKSRLLAAGLDPDNLFKAGDPRLCPITLELFEDPVFFGENSFEFYVLKSLFDESILNKQSCLVHPLTRKHVFIQWCLPFEEQFQRNRALKDTIDQYVTKKILKTYKEKEMRAALSTPEWKEKFEVMDAFMA